MATRRTPSAFPAVILLVAVIVVVTAGIFYLTVSSKQKTALEQKARAEQKTAEEIYKKSHPPATLEQSAPTKVNATTPATLTLDYGFSLEADGPIMVQYPGEKAFLFRPGGECEQLPQPQHSGPKKFWDPKNPKNGHIRFRIYRGNGKC